MARETPFDSVESAYEFVGLLRETIDEAYAEIQNDTDTAQAQGAERRVQALRLVDPKLNQLRQHTSWRASSSSTISVRSVGCCSGSEHPRDLSRSRDESVEESQEGRHSRLVGACLLDL